MLLLTLMGLNRVSLGPNDISLGTLMLGNLRAVLSEIRILF